MAWVVGAQVLRGAWWRGPPNRRFLFANATPPSLSSTPRRDYPTSVDDYDLLEECGRGVSATVSAEKKKKTAVEADGEGWGQAGTYPDSSSHTHPTP